MATIRVLCEPYNINNEQPYARPFNAIQAIKTHRGHTWDGLAVSKRKLIDAPVTAVEPVLLWETDDIKSAIKLYHELKLLNVPVIIEGLTPAARILYGF